jgi:endonuclease/exonuclease/phosphatase family metal-dependent hydrolase
MATKRGWRNKARIGALSVGLLAVLAGCGGRPPLRKLACADAPPLAVVTSADGTTQSARFSVLTYNLEGLPWPARSGRKPYLQEIGARLAAMNADGSAPDIVLFQEMFSPSAKKAVAASGYGAIAPGPRRVRSPEDGPERKLSGKSKPLKGEIGLRVLGSGLSIASRYPIVERDREAFGPKACAGFDCLANKGVMMARIYLPGVPLPVDIYNSHMNARGASKVPEKRNLEAHRRQVAMASAFIADSSDDDIALIFGGDFNMRHSEARWEGFSEYHPLNLVHKYCVDEPDRCDVAMSWDGDAPWMDTQDLQFFSDGQKMDIRPVKVESMFDGGPSGPRLSDHDGLKVTYEIQWPVTLKGEGGASEMVKSYCKK